MTWLDEELKRNPNPLPPKIPERYRAASLGGIPRDHPLWDVTFRYIDGFYEHAAKGVAPVLLGPTGEWKTYAASVIAQLAGARLETEFVSVPDAFVLLAADRYSAATRARMQALMCAPFCVLDDFFWPKPGSWESLTLQAILSARFNGLRPTCVTGNLVLPRGGEFDALANSYGPLLARRLRDAGGPFVAILEQDVG